jgi:hypothetical protein
MCVRLFTFKYRVPVVVSIVALLTFIYSAAAQPSLGLQVGMRFKQIVSTPGKHMLKIILVDPTVVVMKVVIHDSLLPASFFGAPVSFYP